MFEIDVAFVMVRVEDLRNIQETGRKHEVWEVKQSILFHRKKKITTLI